MDSLTPSAQDLWSKKNALKGQGHMAKVKVKVSFVLNTHKNVIFMQQIFFSIVLKVISQGQGQNHQ